MDLKNVNNEIKTCYLAYCDIEKLIKFTSYCNCLDMFLNTLSKNNNINIKNVIENNGFIVDKIYYRKTKNSNNIEVIYKDNEDLFYIEKNDIYRFLKKEELNEYEKTKKIYKFMDTLITNNHLRKKIVDNFDEKYDYDKNLDFVKYKNLDFYKKIMLMDNNILETLNYIFKDPYKKNIFLKYLKEITNKKLISDDKLNLNKKKKEYSLLNNGFKAKTIINEINKNILNFLGIKKEYPNNYELASDDDFIERYQKLIDECDDNMDDLVLYVDSQKQVNKKTR